MGESKVPLKKSKNLMLDYIYLAVSCCFMFCQICILFHALSVKKLAREESSIDCW